MSRSHFLPFYLILALLPSLSFSILNKPFLAKSSYLELERSHGEGLDDYLLVEHVPDLQLGQQKPNRGSLKSFFGFTKLTEKLPQLLKTQTRIKNPENNVLISWEVCYDIAEKVAKSSKSPEVKATEMQNIAKAVLQLGPHFDLHQDRFDTVEIKKLISIINLLSLSLENDSSNTAERIWAFGALSFLRSRLPEEDRNSAHSAIPAFWTAVDFGRPREQFLLFFLQDKDLGKVAQEMWSEVPSKLETSEYVIQEVIQRESIVNLIMKQMRMARHRPSAKFQSLYLEFINLKPPISYEEAVSLMKSVINHLEHPNIPTDGFDEEENTVRLLLHLEEYHPASYRQFNRRSIESREASKVLLTQLRDPKIINGPLITKILNTLQQEQMSSAQLGRLFRALNFVVNRDRSMYTYFHNRLYDYSEMVPKLFEMLKQRRYGQADPASFPRDSLEYLIYIEDVGRIAKQYRKDLASLLVSKGVLTRSDTTADLAKLVGFSKQKILEKTLYEIFKKVSEAKTFEHNDKETEVILAEYILHLISFKTDDMALYRHLAAYKKDPHKLPASQTQAFQMLSEEIFRFFENTSWDHHQSFDEFKVALEQLQIRIPYMNYMAQDFRTGWDKALGKRIGQGYIHMVYEQEIQTENADQRKHTDQGYTNIRSQSETPCKETNPDPL
ncbi:hypothetical protein DFH28DRAFT_1107343 [Melampsora americana]|nr:hypothetical protein DFH28DRAFT_1107343 [Melampsora americana]